MRRPLPWLALWVLLLSLPLQALSQRTDANNELTLSGPGVVSKEGYFTLQVGVPVSVGQAAQPLQIAMSEHADMSAVSATYRPLGDFQQLTLSGFADGSYYFQARLDDAGNDAAEPLLSDIVRVDVKHYSHAQAYGLFIAGALLFSILVILVLCLHRTRNTDNHG
ncbi:hypothetical protein [Idiomarina xiamenensis]|uniref:Uncharacterized protein n=1 Tax=Idiomarina xiamenensis 10-D-4 TaxID=740709 RepID=K2JHT6_9GAMM|nr:hypothetical protein [Idiomarina xiamenensis]EKE82946.1 hypothetical protein A10D4_08904 [Idiomarina xiamenensis 10-D-4]